MVDIRSVIEDSVTKSNCMGGGEGNNKASNRFFSDYSLCRILNKYTKMKEDPGSVVGCSHAILSAVNFEIKELPARVVFFTDPS